MKGTVMDSNCRYHASCGGLFSALAMRFNISLNNRARFGSTIVKGFSIIKKDIFSDEQPMYAIIEFGGNDSDFNWKEISDHPDEHHEPFTPIDRFIEVYESILELLSERNITPISMNLPPIDPERYLDFVCRSGNSKKNILRWLGGTPDTIYNFHRGYSQTIEELSKKHDLKMIDVRGTFISEKNYSDRLCLDGIHPNEKGYELITKAVEDQLLSHSA